ncbi:MAG: hypothetical protein ACRC35_02650 [Angustibacter sp.]
MIPILVSMVVVLVVAGVVVALVAVPARRQGRDVLSVEGEQIVDAVRERTANTVGTVWGRVGDRTPTRGRRPSSGRR